MKEITRIHIAKTAYDVELAAKKALESYLATLEAYSDDTDIIDDIEIRITEILAERGVKKDGVITDADVKALKQQLGEPHEFMGEGDIAVGTDAGEKLSGEATRKLYRDTDNAVLGGVLSGIAAFFKINPMWVRLLFILATLASFGAAVLAYIVLWIAVPAARTAADKLQMNGRPVTVSSIRELNENEVDKPGVQSSVNARRVVTMLLGIICVLAALGALIMTGFAGVAGIVGEGGPFSTTGSGLLLAAFILTLVSGILLTILFILLAYASFAQKMTRRVLISISIVIVLGLATFGTAIGLVQYSNLRYDTDVSKTGASETKLALPSDSKLLTMLAIDTPGLDVQYVVDAGKSSAVVRSIAKDDKNSEGISLSSENGALKVVATNPLTNAECDIIWCAIPRKAIIIYGPALTRITASPKSTIEYHAETQDQLAITTGEGAEVAITTGSIKSLALVMDSKSEVDTSQVSVERLEATVKSGVTLEAGTIQSLTIADQKSCPAHNHSRIEIGKVGDPTITLNNVSSPAKSTTMNCTKLSIESEDQE